MIKTKMVRELSAQVPFVTNDFLVVETIDKSICVDTRHNEIFAVFDKFSQALEFVPEKYDGLSRGMKIRVNSLLIASLQNDLEKAYDELRFLESNDDLDDDVEDLKEA